MQEVKKTVFLGALLAAVIGAPVDAEPLLCDDPALSVSTADATTRDLTCTAASDARKAVEICGLSQTQPIEIKIVDSPIHNIGDCLAVFDCNQSQILVIDPDLLRGHLEPGDAYAALPNNVVFRSLLTHELAHALVHQSSEGRNIAPVDHEYIASALELVALSPTHRKTLLDAGGVEPPVSADLIDIFIYGIAPRRFAATAYLFFEANGCETIEGIIDGSSSFQVER
ncbi:DUF6639 family protein [Actibacterium pelagium]|uniref:Uncharacterized protein n=1 Tax=Actibacterium pelagium TaxID=2029103 RepID=A0A917ELI2_9RHOB|nr:DUF6639 family protein [Actibacterium pelagium]GGE57715.1 hypothetical protein GCM10011517_26870 [Actibacterium pelagium]